MLVSTPTPNCGSRIADRKSQTIRDPRFAISDPQSAIRRGWALWLTGRPASGKTTLARALRHKLGTLGIAVVILDSDEVRRVLTPDPTYTPEERDRFYAGLVDLAELLTRYGVNVIIAATGSQRSYREAARKQLFPFAEVWVRCPIDVCRERDPKGLYARADAGAIDHLPGAGAPYEPPETPAVIVDTDRQTPEEAAEKVLAEVPFLTRGVGS
jgi:adenylylsulfate kinase